MSLTPQEKCDKVGELVAQLKDLLSAEVTYSSTLDKAGKATRKITLTYEFQDDH